MFLVVFYILNFLYFSTLRLRKRFPSQRYTLHIKTQEQEEEEQKAEKRDAGLCCMLMFVACVQSILNV